VTLGELEVGDVVLIRPGGRVPADGFISDDTAEIDESMVTGESPALLFYIAVASAVIAWVAVGRVDEAVVRSVAVLVIACPHALGLAIPLVTSISTSPAARNGILVKDRLALERMRTVDVVLFDKTGTLTKGRHTVTGVEGPDRCGGRQGAQACRAGSPRRGAAATRGSRLDVAARTTARRRSCVR